MTAKQACIRVCAVALAATAVLNVVTGAFGLAVLCALAFAFVILADAVLGALEAIKAQSARFDRAEAALEGMSARIARLEPSDTAGPDREKGAGNGV